MMESRAIKHKRFVIRVLLVLSLLCFVLGVYGLRQNNLTMIRLRDKVYEADKNNSDVETPLRNLRAYVYAHMNTDLASGSNGIRPPLQLKYRYERLTQAEKDRVAAINAKIYTEGQRYCETLYPADVSISGRARVPCIQNYVTQNGVKADSIPDSLYKFDFVSPSWSFDVAGWSLMAGFVSLLAVIVIWYRK